MEDKQAALIPKFTTTENKFRTLTNVFKIDSIEMLSKILFCENDVRQRRLDVD